MSSCAARSYLRTDTKQHSLGLATRKSAFTNSPTDNRQPLEHESIFVHICMVWYVFWWRHLLRRRRVQVQMHSRCWCLQTLSSSAIEFCLVTWAKSSRQKTHQVMQEFFCLFVCEKSRARELNERGVTRGISFDLPWDFRHKSNVFLAIAFSVFYGKWRETIMSNESSSLRLNFYNLRFSGKFAVRLFWTHIVRL